MRSVVFGMGAALALMSPASAEDSVFKDVMDQAVPAWVEPDGSKQKPEEVRAAVEYVIGNVVNTLFHEFGHAMVSEFQINVLGKEEDAVDSFADVTMIADEKDPVLDTMMIDVVRAWFDSGKFNSDQGYLPDYADEHSVDEQRGYETVCILVGASEERFGKIADEVQLPPERREGCADEYVRAYNSWVTALGDNYLDENEEPKNHITVKWEEPTPELKPVADLLKASHVIEAVAEQIEYTFRLPNPATLAVSVCQEDNAFWSPEDRTLTLCYEIVEGYRQAFVRRREAADAAKVGEPPQEEPAEEPADETTDEPAEEPADPK